MSVSGKSGASAISKPPNPHPISANSGLFPESAYSGYNFAILNASGFGGYSRE